MVSWKINSHLFYSDQYTLEKNYFWDDLEAASMEDEHTILTHFYTSKANQTLHPLTSEFTLLQDGKPIEVVYQNVSEWVINGDLESYSLNSSKQDDDKPVRSITFL